jgi:hypothetical protein
MLLRRIPAAFLSEIVPAVTFAFSRGTIGLCGAVAAAGRAAETATRAAAKNARDTFPPPLWALA